MKNFFPVGCGNVEGEKVLQIDVEGDVSLKKFEVRMRIVTPLFMGGAEPSVLAEVRAPALKGTLRYWYRVADPAYRDHEFEIFGSTCAQSSFLLRAPVVRGNNERFKASVSTGMGYLGFSMRGDKKSPPRPYLPPGRELGFEMIFRKEPREYGLRAVAASWWLMALLGGLGARSRRGFGSLEITGWPGEFELPVPAPDKTVKEWWDRFNAGLKLIRRWFPGSPDLTRTVLSGARFYLFKSGYKDYQGALNRLGTELKEFRSQLSRLDRTALGLPMVVQGKGTYEGTEHKRSASPVFFRVVRIGGMYYPLVAVLKAPLLEAGEKIAYSGKRLSPPDRDAVLGDFCRRMKENSQQEAIYE